MNSNNNLIAEKTDSATFFFYCDNKNNPIAFSYNGKMFYYVKNLQGDIVKILDEDGQEKADYVYNAWGNILSQSEDELSSINPLRYRGYVYDEDTTLYYLQTRYYDPTTGRFINADDTVFISSSGTAIGDNIYTYCENDPVNNVDYTGQWYHNLSSYYNAHKKMYEGYPDAWQAFCTRYNKLKKRYKDNRSALGRFSGYIYGQKNKKVKNLKYGSNNATVASVGCELIAIYNTLKRLGKFQYFYQVMLEAEMNDMDMLGGLWGTNSLSIAGYFDFHKIKRDMYQGESTFDRFIKSIKKAKIAIISLWNDHFYNGIHTYCIEYDKKSKKYNAYNKDVYSTDKTPINIKSFAKKQKSNFIIGFTF